MRSVWILALLSCVAFPCIGQTLSPVSGNGQVVWEQFATDKPLVVRAADAAGRPLPNVAITWSLATGTGNIIGQSTTTDANGEASAKFFGSSLQLGPSYLSSTVRATSTYGVVNFSVVTVRSRLSGGGVGPLPLALLEAPQSLALFATAGSTLPQAIAVRAIAQSGIDLGNGVPGVGVRLQVVNPKPENPTVACRTPSPDGIILTDAKGIALCDVVISGSTQPATVQFFVVVGEYQNRGPVTLTISPGSSCTFSLSPTGYNANASGGTSTIQINTTAECSWTAAPSAPWISIVGANSGRGSAQLSYTVGTNTGAARNASIKIGTQDFPVSQTAAGSSGGAKPTFTAGPTLPATSAGLSYSIALSATGGTAPYSWSSTGTLPPGLALNASTGLLSGVPNAAGTYTFSATVRDAANTTDTRNFTLTVNGSTPSGLLFTTSSFPNGTVNTSYAQAVNFTGGCASNPFGGPPVVSVASGSLPPGLTLGPLPLASSGIGGTPTTAGRYEFALRVADACGASSTRSFTITIEGGGTAPVQISALPTSLAFQVERSNSAPPPTQSIALATATGAVGFSALGESEGNWLTVTPAGGFTPATLAASVSNYSALAPGTYTGRVAISSQAGRVLVPVTLTVGAAPAEITLSASNLSFTHVAGTTFARTSQLINVNSASPTPFTASAVATTGGTWLSATPSSGTAPANVEIAANPAGLAVGEYSGVVTFTPVNNSAAAKVVQVRLSVTAAPTLSVLPSTISIPYQQGGPTPAAQQINTSSSGAPITFTATAAGGSWLSISGAQTTTPGLLQANFNPSGLAPGSYTGTITIQPTVGAPVVVNVTLTVTSPAMLLSAVTSAASFKADVVSPGELVTLFGSKLGPEGLTPYQLTAERRLDTTLAETRVLFDGVPAPLLYVSAEQISAIVPYNVSSASTTRVEVEYKGQRTNVLQVPVGLSSPALFTVGGTTKAAALNQDTSVNGYPAAAQVGSIVSFYATGAGTLAPAPADGEIVNSVTLPRALQDVGITIAGRTAEVLYQGAAPGLPAGMLQVNVRIPAETPAGDVPVLLYVGGKSSPAGVTISVR